MQTVEYFQTMDRHIRYIINLNKKIAIYLIGMLGIYAKNILNDRYGKDGIYIDNIQSSYSEDIISFSEFCERDFSDYVVLVCVSQKELENNFISQCEKAGIKVMSICNPCIESNVDKTDFFKNIIKACEIKKTIGFPLVRIGKYSDGGYVMLDDLRDIECCYSFGIGSETSWEEDMAEKDLDIYCYDHTISHMPGHSARFHFFRNGVAGDDTSDGIFKSLSTIMEQNDIHSSNLILKMDIEGAEWEVIQKTGIEIISSFRQMTFEFHGLTNISREREILTCLNKLKIIHQPVWIHGNNAGIAEKSGEYIVPEMLEITYVRKNNYAFENCDYSCPGYLDSPNVDSHNEISLHGWGTRISDYGN